jgi:hypothetical protein
MVKTQRAVTNLNAPNTACTRPLEEHQDYSGGTAVLVDGVRVFKPFAWLGVGSVKVALSRPAHQYPEGA